MLKLREFKAGQGVSLALSGTVKRIGVTPDHGVAPVVDGHDQSWAFVDRGLAGTGEPLLVLLRPGNAGPSPASIGRRDPLGPR